MLSESILVHPGLAYPVLDRVTMPMDPEEGHANYGALSHAYWMLGYGEQWRESNEVNEHSALKVNAVWACVRYISQTIASLGWHTYEKSAKSRSQIPIEDDVAWLLDMQANPETNSLDWRQVLLAHALTHGNGYAEIERDAFGKPRWLWQLCPDDVSLERTDAGRLTYKVDNGNNRDPTYLPPENVFHLKGLGCDGLVGYSVIQMARRNLQLGADQETFGSRFYRRGPTPGGVLQMPGNVKKEERAEVRDSFERTYGGAHNAGRVVVLSGGMEFQPISMSNSDAQFLESRRFSIEDICRWYGVPPHKIADLSKSSFSNIEQQSIEAVQDCLLPWCRRLESEADVKLFGRTQRGRRYTRLNLAALLRGDSMTQTDTVVKKINAAVMTPNEGREYFDLNPIKGGDKLLVQGAMISLDRALEAPAPAPPNKNLPSEQQPPNENQQQKQQNLAILGPLVAAYARVLRVEADKAKRAHKQGRLKEHVAAFHGEENIACLAAAIRPFHEQYLASIGIQNGAVERLVSERAAACNNASRQALAGGKLELIEDWLARAALAAVDDLQAFARLSRSEPAPQAATPPPAAPPIRVVPVFNITMPRPVIKLNQEGDTINFAPGPAPAVNIENLIQNSIPDVMVENVINVPEQQPAAVHVDNVVNVPEQPAAVIRVPRQRAPKVENVINLPETPAMQPVFNLPEQAAPVVNVTTAAPEVIVNVPEGPAPVVNVPRQRAPRVRNVIQIPEGPAPTVNVQLPELPAPVVNIEAAAAPVVNVEAPEVTVSVPEQPATVVPPADVHVHFPRLKPRKAVRGADGAWRITEEPDGGV